MRQYFLSGWLAILVFSVAPPCYGQAGDSLWAGLNPFFHPPANYASVFGHYRSPLTFYDGREVKTAADWPERRREILNRWQNLMGHWPALIAHPSFTILETAHRDNFVQYRIRFYWRPDETTDGYLLVPDAPGKKPAVINVFYEPQTGVGLKKPDVDFAYQLAKRGFVTLSVGTAAVATGKPYAQYYPDDRQASLQPLSMLAYLAANSFNLLADRPEVDAARIGIIGHSYGSKWAMFASCLYEKFACAVWSDGGIVFDSTRPNVNYWDPWYLGYYPPPWTEKPAGPAAARGLYPELINQGYDLTELHALMAPRPFLVSGGSEDSLQRWIPLNQAIRVNELLGFHNRVGMTNRPDHSPNPESNEKVWLFFEYFLRPGRPLP